MAHLPTLRPESSFSDAKAAAIGEKLADGVRPMELARRKHPNDRRRRMAEYMRIRRSILHDERVRQRIVENAQIEMTLALVPTVRAMAGRAARGRTDAGKLILEASGFHNPRVKHDHSGQVEIKLTMPRPARQIEPAIDGEAEVVD